MKVWWLLPGLLLLLLSACREAEETPLPTLAVMETFTPTAAPTSTATLTMTPTASATFSSTPSPTATATLSDTPVILPSTTSTATASASPNFTPLPAITLEAALPQGANAEVTGPEGVNLRTGAGYVFEVQGILENGTPLTLIGRTEDEQWYQAVTFEAVPRVGWVLAELITPRFDTRLLAITGEGQALTIAGVACGMNIDPRRGQGWPEVPVDFRKLDWVRFVFLASPQHFRSLEDAFAFYDPVIATYNQMGTRVLLVLTHETHSEGQNWLAMSERNWNDFTVQFAATARQIAAHYGDQVAAYEIWNEGDAEAGNAAAVSISPATFARMLSQTSIALRAGSPNAFILSGGLLDASGSYIQQVRRAAGGVLPVDGIAIHPYGRGAPLDTSIFANYGAIGEVIEAYRRAAPGYPLWITEIGAVGDNSAPRWEAATHYLQNLTAHLRGDYDAEVNALIWYAWSDAMHPQMRVNGLVTAQNQRKPPLYDTFFALCG
jgi:hypothetical protein